VYLWFETIALRSPGYALMVALGLLAAGVVFRMFPIETPDKQGFVLFPAVVGLLIGAKLPVIISYGWNDAIMNMGKSLLGGLMGAYIAVRLAKQLRGIPWVGGGDAYVLPISIAVALGRVGCLFNGCCMGKNGFPAPVLEIGFHLTMFGLVLFWRQRRILAGSWFPLYMLSYCIFRFCVEFIRTEPHVFAGLTAYHWLSLLGIMLFTMELRYRRRRDKETGYEQRPME